MKHLNELITLLEQMDDLFLRVDPKDIKPEHNLTNDLGIDSLTRLAILFELQDQLRLDLDQNVASNWSTIEDILELYKRQA